MRSIYSALFTVCLVAVVPVGLIESDRPALAQATNSIEPLTVEGQLDRNSEVMEDGSYFVAHPFEGTAGQRVTIDLVSQAFDAYLLLFDSSGNKIAENDNADNSTNAQISIVLPVAGNYIVIANSRNAGETGSYTLSLQSTTAEATGQRRNSGAESAEKQEADRLYQQGLQQFQERNFSEALFLFEQALEKYRKVNDQVAEATLLANLGVIYQSLKEYPQALEQFSQALVISHRIGDREGEGRVLHNLGAISQSLGQYLEALAYYQEALKIAREINDQETEVITLSDIGSVYSSLDQYLNSLDFYEQALAIANETEIISEKAIILNNLGKVHYRIGRFSDALDFFQQALAICRDTGNHEQENIALNGIGLTLYEQGHYMSSLDFFQQALSIEELNNQSSKGTTLNNIGLVYEALGQYVEAMEQFQYALRLLRQVDNKTMEGTTLNNIGSLYANQGQPTEALKLYQQALAVLKQSGDRAEQGRTLGNIGQVYRFLGQYPQALDYHQQALAISREISDQSGEAASYNGIAAVYENLGQYVQAGEFYQKALSIYQSANDQPGESTVLNNIAGLYYVLGQYAQALQYYQQALAIVRETGYRFGEGRTLNNIGNIYSNQERYTEAMEYYEQSLIIRREIGDLSGEGTILNNIGEVYYSQGQYQKALEQFHQSITIRRKVSDQLGESNSLDSAGRALYGLGQLAAAAETFYQAITKFESLRSSELSDFDKITLFDTYVETYAALQQTLIAQNNPEKTLKALEVSEQGRARSLVELLSSRLAQSDSAINSNPPDVAEIRRIAQQQNATLVQYSVVDSEVGDPALYIWVIQPSGDIRFHSVDLAQLHQPLSDLVTLSRTAIGARGRSNATIVVESTPEAQQRQSAAQKQALQQLYQLLIQPIEADLPANPEEKVAFIPQSELFLVPFAALVDNNGKYLIEHHTIFTAPSIQVLDLADRAVQPQSLNRLKPDQVLVVGNPTMPQVWNADLSQQTQLSSLPGTEQEAEAIAQQFGTQPLLGSQATEATITQRMQTARLIHLATHGLLEYGDPTESGVLDAPGAIALAADANHDGLLTALELYQMKLQADLVVLSACDTGRGNITGDGVVGLSRSIIQAGVPSLVVSLWKVPDDSTAYLMTRFYQNLQHFDKAQALRQAMLETIQKYPEPINWAAFTLIGAPE